MNLAFHILLCFWMLLATMPFSISMHYCKGMETNSCTAGIQCCSSQTETSDESIVSLCCSTDCCSELSITSIPEEQFKNNHTSFKQLYSSVGLILTPASQRIRQNFFIQKIKNIPPKLVKKAFAVNQSFLC